MNFSFYTPKVNSEIFVANKVSLYVKKSSVVYFDEESNNTQLDIDENGDGQINRTVTI